MESFLKFLRDRNITEANKRPSDPPAVMVMRRKSIRQFPNGQRIAIYHIDALKMDVTVPYDAKGTTLGISMSENEEL